MPRSAKLLSRLLNRAQFLERLYGCAAGLKVLLATRPRALLRSTLTLLAPPGFLPLGIARGRRAASV